MVYLYTATSLVWRNRSKEADISVLLLRFVLVFCQMRGNGSVRHFSTMNAVGR